jgi:hypothetical protein
VSGAAVLLERGLGGLTGAQDEQQQLAVRAGQEADAVRALDSAGVRRRPAVPRKG